MEKRTGGWTIIAKFVFNFIHSFRATTYLCDVCGQFFIQYWAYS